MQKFNMIQAFAELPEGMDATFVHPEGQVDQARLIKMRLNAPQDVNLYITPCEIDYETGEVVQHRADAARFLAHVAAGFEQIEFYYQGSFCLSTLGGSVWLDTSDNTAFSVEASDFTSYARLWEREERDPRILEIERAARHNQELLLRQMAEDRAAYAAQMAAIEERMSANVTPVEAPASGGTAGDEPPVPSGAPASDPAAAAAVPAGTGGASDERA